MSIFLQLLSTIILWIACIAGSWFFVNWEEKPEWLKFGEVMMCRKCCYFWLNLFSTLGFFFIFGSQYWWFLGSGLLLTILSTIAIIFQESNAEMSYEDVVKAMEDEKNNNQNV